MLYRQATVKEIVSNPEVEAVPVLPVEPDLKASFDMMRDQPVLSDWKDWQIEQWAKSIVGAALKEGA